MQSLSIQTIDYLAEEGRESGAFLVTRSGDLSTALSCTVNFGGTAQSGTDYEVIQTTVQFAAGQDSVVLTVNPLTDGSLEGSETVVCQLVDSVGYEIAQGTASLAIRDTGYKQDGFVAPLSESLSLNSLPEADHTIYLNFFGGDYYFNNNGTDGRYVSPYDLDGNSASLSDQERFNIQQIWAAVAEDFAPFNINVTTETPLSGALTKSGDDDLNWGVSVLIGGDPGYGFAWSGSYFSSNSDYPGYVSEKGSWGYFDTELIAQAVSHEVGHTLGLQHDGPGDGGYYVGHDAGTGTWIPIMGIAKPGINQWSIGDYSGANNQEDDLAIITSSINGFGYRVDDHADSSAFATKLVILDDGFGTLFGQGIIEQNIDADWFQFSHTGGRLLLNVEPTGFAPNLDISATLFDSSSNVVKNGSINDSMSASISLDDLAAGEYYLKVEGEGSSIGEGYSDYGSLGQYKITSGLGVLASYDPDSQSAGSTISGTTQFSSLSVGELSGSSVGNGSWDDVWALWWDARGSIDPSEYISFAVTPGANEELALSSLSASFYSFASGDTFVTLRSSLDGFASSIDARQVLDGNAATLIEFNLDSLPRVDDTIEFRLYMSSNSGAGYRYLTGSSYQYDTNAQGIKLVGRALSERSVDTTPKIMGSFDFGAELTSNEVAVDATLNVTTSYVEDGQLVTLVLNGKTYTSEVSANQAQIVIEATDLIELNAGTVAYTLSVSNSDNIRAADYTSEFVYDLTVDIPASALRATNINEKVRLDQLFNELANDSSSEIALIEIVSGPIRGSLENDDQGHWYYVPDQNYVGNDSFSFRASGTSGEVSEVMAFDLIVKNLPTIQPTPENPFSPSSNSSATATLLAEADARKIMAPELVTADPTAEILYGVIPDGAARVIREVSLDVAEQYRDPVTAQSSTYYTTGLYAAPGELVYIEVPSEMVGIGAKIRLSTWNDDLSGRSEWDRAPYAISRIYDIDEPIIKVAGAFGGLIYLDVPLGTQAQTVTLKIDGAIEAPHFILGETTNDEWVNEIRDNPAPFGVLAAGNIELYLPSDILRTLDNPTEVMTWWSRVIDILDDLSGKERLRPEAYSFDVDTQAGFLSAGYPNKGPLDYADNFLDLDTLQAEGLWGAFHEFAHLHQDTEFTIGGDAEVNVNIFALYVYDQLGIYHYNTTADRRVETADSLFDNNLTYQAGDPWQKLTFYHQIIQEFGFEPFKTFFRTYYDDSPESLAWGFGSNQLNDQQEVSQLFVRLSTIIGRDLSPHFDAWNFQDKNGNKITSADRAAVAHLPDWSVIDVIDPEETLVLVKDSSTSIDFDLSDNVWNLESNGALIFTPASNFSNGELISLGGGAFRFTPSADFSGSEAITINVANSDGGLASITVVAAVGEETTFTIGQDTYIGKEVVGSQEDSQRIVVDGRWAPNEKAIPLIKFTDIFGDAEGQIKYQSDIFKAILQLETTEGFASFDLVPIVSEWSDSITWEGSDLLPSNVSLATDAEDSAPYSSTAATLTFDVTDSLKAWVAGESQNNGWALIPSTNSDGTPIHSFEATDPTLRPKLTITWSAIDMASPVSNAPQFASETVSLSIDENDAGLPVIYTAELSDNSTSDATISYSLSGPDASLFTVSERGAVRLLQPADFEAKQSYSLTLSLTDGINPRDSQILSVSVNNLNDNAPTFDVATQTVKIDENSLSSDVVFDASASDKDGDLLTYTLSGTDKDAGVIDAETGEVRLTSVPDFEVKSSYYFTVTVSDGGASVASQDVIVVVNDIDETMPVFSAPSVTVTVVENSSTNNIVFTAQASDGDGSVLDYSLGGKDAGLFEINSITGEVSLKIPADYESKSSYSFNVIASDGVNTDAAQQVTLNVLNVNDNAPDFLSPNASGFVEENAPLTTVVFKAIAQDLDGDSLSYSVSGTDASWLSIDPLSGEVRLKQTAVGSEKSEYVFSVNVSDGEYEETQSVTLNVVQQQHVLTMDNSVSLVKTKLFEGVSEVNLNEGLVMIDRNSDGTLRGGNYDYLSTKPYTQADDGSLTGTLFNTNIGGLVAFSQLQTGGRVAVFANQNLMQEGLYQDPGNGDWGRVVFNSMNWASGVNRGTDSDTTLYVLNLGDPMVTSDFTYKDARSYNYSADDAHSLKITSFNYSKPSSVSGALNAGDILSDALDVDSTWSEPVDLVILEGNVTIEEINTIREWMARTDGGVILNLGTTPILQPMQEFISSIGLETTRTSGGPLNQVYTPTRTDLFDEDLLNRLLHQDVAGELLALDSDIGLSSLAPITVSGRLSLPNQDALGDLDWSSSETTVISHEGVVVSTGKAVMTATRHLPDGTTEQVEYYVSTHGPLSNAVSGFVIEGVSDFNKLIDIEFLKASTPVFFTTDTLAYDEVPTLPTKGKVSQEKLTTNLIDTTLDAASVASNESIIALAGVLTPEVSGEYVLNVLADDRLALYIEVKGGIQRHYVDRYSTKDDGANISINLEESGSYRFWILYEDGGSNDEWGKDFNYFNVSWKVPGSDVFEVIPSSVLSGQALPSDGTALDAIAVVSELLSSNASSTLEVSPDLIFDDLTLESLCGNQTPLIDNQTLNLLEEFNHIPGSQLSLYESDAEQAAALFLRIKDADGQDVAALEYIELNLSNNLAELASSIETEINSRLPSGRSVNVKYDSASNTIQLVQSDSGSELVFYDFVIAKEAGRNPEAVGSLIEINNGVYAENSADATASSATFAVPKSDQNKVYRINLKMIDPDGVEYNFVDVPLGHFGRLYIANGDSRFKDLTFNQTTDESGENLLVTVKDMLGRDIVDFTLTDLPNYEPLISAIVENGDSSGAITLGAIQGKIDATDPEGRNLTFELVDAPIFGTLTLDSVTGAYTYVPNGEEFKGYDQFHVTVSDGVNTSTPAAIKIIPYTEYTDSPVSITEIRFDDPEYVAIEADYSTPISDDFVLEDVFFAQTYVQRPDDPYLKLVADRWVQFKVNATSASGQPAPEFEVAVYDAQGNKLGQRVLSGPDLLPTSVDLPSDTNLADLDRGHTLDDSYVVSIPGAWVKPGVTFELLINGSPYSIESLGYDLIEDESGLISPDVGAGAVVTMSLYHASLGVDKDIGRIEGGLTSLGEELLAKSPFAGIRFLTWPIDIVEKAINANGSMSTPMLMTGDKDNLPGADTFWGGGGFGGTINWAYANSAKMVGANFLAGGWTHNGWYSNTSIDAGEGGGVGGGYKGGGDAGTITTQHEFFGHGGGIGHVAFDASFPYNSGVNPDISFEITDTLDDGTVVSYVNNGMIGSDWAFDQDNGVYLPNYRIDGSGNVSMVTSPMAGSQSKASDYQFALFSDWELSERLMPNADRLVKWSPNEIDGVDSEDGGYAGDGYFSIWDLPERTFNTGEITGVAGDAREIVLAELIYTDERSADRGYNTVISIKERPDNPGNKIKIDNETPNAFAIKVTLDDQSVHTLNLTKEWVVINSQNPFGFDEARLPHEFNQDVYYVTADLIDINGSALGAGAIPSPDITMRVRKSIGDLPADYFDVVRNSGDIHSNTEFVARVTYMTDTGLYTAHLAVPNGAIQGDRSFGLNLPVKGELVRVDLVDTRGSDISYADNKIIATTVNPEALANALVGYNDFVTKANYIKLPDNWNGGSISWVSSQEGLVNLETGAVDVSLIDDLSSITATVSFENIVEIYRFKVADLIASTALPSVNTNLLKLLNTFAQELNVGSIRLVDINNKISNITNKDQLAPTNTQILSAELEETTDGAVDISDVISQLRHIVGLSELTGLNKAAADNDANGSVDISDVISSLRQIVGLQEAPNARIVDAKGNHQFMFDDRITELYVVAAGDADLSWTPLELI